MGIFSEVESRFLPKISLSLASFVSREAKKHFVLSKELISRWFVFLMAYLKNYRCKNYFFIVNGSVSRDSIAQ